MFTYPKQKVNQQHHACHVYTLPKQAVTKHGQGMHAAKQKKTTRKSEKPKNVNTFRKLYS